MVAKLHIQKDILSGNDYLSGMSGNDELNGDTGKNTRHDSFSNRTQDGGPDSDSLLGGSGSSWYLIKEPDSDNITGPEDEEIDGVYLPVKFTLQDYEEYLALLTESLTGAPSNTGVSDGLNATFC